MSLLAVGAADQYVNIAPEMTYFKQVYKRCTNFSMESARMTFATKPTLDTSRNTFSCKISRIGDLLQQIYLSFELPDIYSDDDTRFRWIKNLANHMIYSYSVRIDSQLIDQKWGEWMDIWTELTVPEGKREGYRRMCGSTDAYANPTSYRPLATIINNRIEYTYYPSATATQPSIRKKRFFVPLDFWFTRSPSSALPLVALQYQTVEVIVELRAIEELYQVYDKYSGQYMSPTQFLSLSHNAGKDVSISRFLQFGGNGPKYVDLNAYLECNFIFLDETERRAIAGANADFLVERMYRTEKGGVVGQGTIELILANPVKEMVFITRRADAYKYNEWANFTGAHPENENFPILASAKILWNGLERMEEKPAEYFQLLQPFQHHTNNPREGIYCYSYAIYPEKLQPSGSFNATMIGKMQLYVTTNTYEENEEYEFVVYHTYYNVFRIMGGSGGMVFQV